MAMENMVGREQGIPPLCFFLTLQNRWPTWILLTPHNEYHTPLMVFSLHTRMSTQYGFSLHPKRGGTSQQPYRQLHISAMGFEVVTLGGTSPLSLATTNGGARKTPFRGYL
jgi:hypothetical protein